METRGLVYRRVNQLSKNCLEEVAIELHQQQYISALASQIRSRCKTRSGRAFPKGRPSCSDKNSYHEIVCGEER